MTTSKRTEIEQAEGRVREYLFQQGKRLPNYNATGHITTIGGANLNYFDLVAVLNELQRVRVVSEANVVETAK